MNVVVDTGKLPLLLTPAGVAEISNGLAPYFAQQGLSYRPLKKEVVKVAGVTAGRLVGELTLPTGDVTALVQYSVPGDMSHATITFTTTPENLIHYEPIFEAAAQATRGAVEPRPKRSIGSAVLRDGIIGGIAGGIAALVLALVKRRRRAAAVKSAGLRAWVGSRSPRFRCAAGRTRRPRAGA